MNSMEQNYIDHCKILIEEKLGWAESSTWKQRDYLNLIELLETNSAIVLSLSTIKRIWKPNYNGIPHPSTLDALAQFLEYKNWVEFKEQNKSCLPEIGNGAVKKTVSKNLTLKIKLSVIFFFIVSLFIISALLFWSKLFTTSTKKFKFNPASIEFSCSNSVSRGVPNTIIFHYDVSKIDADSFFIQQSWNKYRRDKVSRWNNNFTCMYYYPGNHKAKIIANDSILKETDIRINTDNWLTLVRYDYMEDIPVYIRNNNIQKNGVLHVSEEHLKNNKVELNSKTIVSYYYVDDFKNVGSGDFSLETRIKCDSIINIACPQIRVCLLGENGIYNVPLTMKGCIGKAMVKLGNTIKYGRDADLSPFGVNIYTWQLLKIVAKNNKAIVYLNNKAVYDLNFTQDIGNVIGFNINFSGTGSIDYIKLYNKDNKLTYHNDFD
jgi:hypothetical protein